MSHSFQNTGKTVFVRPRSHGKAWVQQFIKERLDMDRSGGVFIPEYVQYKLREFEIKELYEAGLISQNKARRMLGLNDKYNLNKRVLIL